MRKTNYRFVWFVAGVRFSVLFGTFALAGGFRRSVSCIGRIRDHGPLRWA